ncbi:UPF0016-domain-containing protein [Atractiella rhizophila]|nr:UPF0016-domain-containing protein [Atractiella rhizophila]KAH8925007.1 UPF0016-domain-containing protein [Atractiella rhizophila]
MDSALSSIDWDPLSGLGRSIAVIVVSELGDKTFLIAALLSMNNPRLLVFGAAISALALMSLLSSLMGTILPSILPRRYTTAAAALLFWVFGARMLKEGIEMKEEDGKEKMEEEMREVQRELADDSKDGMMMESLEGGGILPLSGNYSYSPSRPSPLRQAQSPPITPSPSPFMTTFPSTAPPLPRPTPQPKGTIATLTDGVRNLASLCLSPLFVKCFILTFLAEWGDRSQITTIALAAAHNVWLITIGTTIGHSFCTALACIAGKYIASKISVKQVTLGGAVLFLIFGFVYAYEAWAWEWEPLEFAKEAEESKILVPDQRF